jgi:PiT family inorganic phosphate transporter
MLLLVIAIVISFYMAFHVGSNDGANSMADAVGSKAIGLFWAVILAGIFEFAGAVLVGSHVSDTVRKGIIDTQVFVVDPKALAYGMMCALLASAIWLHISSLLGMPVSTTHSIVGAVFGFGVVFGGFDDVHWGKMGQIVASWFISPVVGGVMAFFAFRLITRHILAKERPINAARKGVPICAFLTFTTVILATIYKGLKNLHLDLSGYEAIGLSLVVGLGAAVASMWLMRRIPAEKEQKHIRYQLAYVEKMFIPMVVITSCSVAFAHGANDVANAVGPLAAIVEIIQTHDVPRKVMIDTWILVLGGGGIAIGLITLGHRVIKTVGSEITHLTPTRGVAADISTSITVLAASRIGLPISTTHTLVGAVLGVGMARGLSAVNTRIVKSIFTSWIATVPFTAVLTVLFYAVLRWLFL